MLTITIPPALAVPLAAEAARRGTTPELLALEGVKRVLPETPEPPPPRTLYDQLKKHIGIVDGLPESFVRGSSPMFTDGPAAEPPARS